MNRALHLLPGEKKLSGDFLTRHPAFNLWGNRCTRRVGRTCWRVRLLVLYGVTACFALLSLVLLHDAAKIALVLAVIGIGVALGVQYLGYAEFSELQELWRRTAERKRVIANNVEVRRALESLNNCAGVVRDSAELSAFDRLRWIPPGTQLGGKILEGSHAAAATHAGR
jgi:hypothetical protein